MVIRWGGGWKVVEGTGVEKMVVEGTLTGGFANEKMVVEGLVAKNTVSKKMEVIHF